MTDEQYSAIMAALERNYEAMCQVRDMLAEVKPCSMAVLADESLTHHWLDEKRREESNKRILAHEDALG
jgi:hypothetical protein